MIGVGRVPRPTLTGAVFAGGLVLLAALVWRVGPVPIGEALVGVGWSALLVPLPHALFALGEASGWRLAFARGSCPLPPTALLRIAVAVKLVQGVAPSMSQATELVRIHLLREAGVPGDRATASVVMAKTMTGIAELAFIVLGVGALIASVAVEPAAAMWALVGIVGLGVVLGGLLAWERRGLFRPLVWLGSRLAFVSRFLERHGALLSSAEALIQEYLSRQRGRFVGATAVFFVTWLAMAFETWVFLWMLGLPATALDALLVQGWLALVTRATAVVPSNVGTLEAGTVMVFALVGLPPAGGMALAVLRRVRQLVWMGMALAVFPRASRAPAPEASLERPGAQGR